MKVKYRNLLMTLLSVLMVIVLVLAGLAVYVDRQSVQTPAIQMEGTTDMEQVEQVRQIPETRDELVAFAKAEIQAMEAAGTLTNDAMTELFTECDAKGYIHITTEGQSYITAKDGGQIMVSELSSTYVHRITEKAFKQLLEISQTYVDNAENLEYGNYYTPFNDSTTNHIDCSSFVQLVLYGIPYETSRYVADKNTAKYDFGIALPDNRYRSEFGPYRYLANDLGRYSVDNGFGFYPNEDCTNMQPGDILFFSTNNRNEGYYLNITHVGICIERQEDGFVYIVHGNSNDVANYYKLDMAGERTPLGSKNAYKDSLVLIARYPVKGAD